MAGVGVGVIYLRNKDQLDEQEKSEKKWLSIKNRTERKVSSLLVAYASPVSEEWDTST